MKVKRRKKIKILLFCLISGFLFFLSQISLAAEMSLTTPSYSVNLNEEIKVNLFLNAQNENINALEGEINYSANLSLVKIKDGESIVSFWIKKPQEKNRIISFAGIIPGGFQEQKGKIFQMIFKVKKFGKSSIKIQKARALLNDGKGTETKIIIKNLNLSLEENKKNLFSSYLKKEKKDIYPPEPFQPMITRSPKLFENKYFLVFATQDKNSGIDHYEVCEGKLDCQKATSPYLLKNQNLDQEIVVKAIDKEGNIQIALIPPQNFYLNKFNKIYFLFIPIIIFIGGLILYFHFYGKKREK